MFSFVLNGIKFTGTRKPVAEIDTAKGNGNVLLTIQDNGTSGAALKKIFEKYGRLKIAIFKVG